MVSNSSSLATPRDEERLYHGLSKCIFRESHLHNFASQRDSSKVGFILPKNLSRKSDGFLVSAMVCWIQKNKKTSREVWKHQEKYNSRNKSGHLKTIDRPQHATSSIHSEKLCATALMVNPSTQLGYTFSLWNSNFRRRTCLPRPLTGRWTGDLEDHWSFLAWLFLVLKCR